MKHTIKTTIGIIAIALSSMTIAEARDHKGERNYEKPRQERSHSKENRRKDMHRSSHRQDYKERRHFRKHKRFDRHAKRHFRAYERSRRHYGWKNRHYRPYKKAYYRTGGYDDNYDTPYYSAPSYSTHVSVSSHGSDHVVPVLAGTLIGSAIANNASGGDPVATFGGAVFGAIVGNAIAHH